MRVWKGVYCNAEYTAHVNMKLLELLVELTREHPNWEFDVDGPDWERDNDEEA
jgi:hypothetical protein